VVHLLLSAVSRKIGKTAMTEMTLTATEWKNTDWAHDKGLYAKVLANQVELDIDIILLKVSFIQSGGFSPNEKIIWEGTDDWDTLLLKERRFQEN
jgi:methylglutaconyl-CoA hydratase